MSTPTLDLSPRPTEAHYARLTALGLKCHWLQAPQPGNKRSGKAPLDKAWQDRPYSPEPVPPPFPGANLGLRTGRVDGAPLQVIVVDLDSAEALAWAKSGALPSTAMRTQTAKGEHWYYRYPENSVKVANRCRITLPSGDKLEIDIRGDGGNVVVAPSVHYSGVQYTECEPWDQINLSEIPVYDPSWLDGRNRAAKTKPTKPAPAPQDVHVDAEETELDALPTEPPTERPGLLPEQFHARLYQNCERRLGGEQAVAALRRMAQEQNYAPDGERNNTLFQAVRLLAEWFPEATDEQLEDFARASVLATGDQAPEKELENFRDVLRRAREKFAQTDHLLLRLSKAQIELTPALIDAGVDLRSRLILTFGTGNHLVMLPDGTYSNAIWKQEKLSQHLDHPNLLGWAEKAGLAQFHFVDEKGKRKRVSWATIAERHGWPVNHWEGSFAARYSRVEGDVFIEAFAPRRRDLTPKYDQRIQDWLLALGGTEREKLLDWLAGFAEFDSPTPALVLVGARKAGKNLLAEGLARYWVAGAPIPFETTTRDFNDALQQCPLLFADEKLPVDARGRVQLDEHLRQLVTARTHVVNRKYRDAVTVRGCLRIIVATNQENFAFVGMNEESIAALAERILHIEVGPAARAYLESLGGRATTESWVKGDGLIRHVMSLAETRQIQRGDRLIVPGNGERLIEGSQYLTGPGADLCTWLCSYLEDPKEANIGPGGGGIVIEEGDVWVCPRVLFAGGEQTWQRYVRHSRSVLPPDTQLKQLFEGLSRGETRRFRVRQKYSGKRAPQAMYYKLRVSQLLRWAERFGFDTEAIQETIMGGSAPPEPGPGTPPAPDTQPVPAPNNAVTELSDTCRDEQSKRDEMCSQPVPQRHGPTLSELLSAEKAEETDVVAVSSVGELAMGMVDLGTFSEPSAEVFRTEVPAQEPGPVVTRVIRHRKPCSAARVKAGEPCVCPAPKETKRKEKPRLERDSSYYTPGVCVWADELRANPPATEQAAVEFFAPRLTLAMRDRPSTYARLTAAYRAYRGRLRGDWKPSDAAETAIETWFDAGDRPWCMDVSLEPVQGGVS